MPKLLSAVKKECCLRDIFQEKEKKPQLPANQAVMHLRVRNKGQLLAVRCSFGEIRDGKGFGGSSRQEIKAMSCCQ